MLAPTKQVQGLKAHHDALTHGLQWTTSYQPMHKVFPQPVKEGLKVHDWTKWEDPLRIAMDGYWKLQSEKEKKLYAVIEAYAQNNGHLGISDARYVNALKLFLQFITPLEYYKHRCFAHLGRHLLSPGARVLAETQSLDELRHFQNQTHTLSLYNRYFSGMHSAPLWFDHAWYLAAPKSFIEDAYTAGPFESLIALSFSFDGLFSNLLFVPFMSGAAHNGDISAVTLGFSAQSDTTRHMTLGLECIKFLLTQDSTNLPIVQAWVDKWFWRTYRLATLMAMMQDYMLPKRSMSWKEAWETYIEKHASALFKDLAHYGLRPPKGWADATEGKNHVSHQAWSAYYQYSEAIAFHTWMPNDEETAWLIEKYPTNFARLYKPRFEHFKKLQDQGTRFQNRAMPLICTSCQFPLIFTEPGDTSRIGFRSRQYRDESFNFCSEHCGDIFDREPKKYLQALQVVSTRLRAQAFKTTALENASKVRADVSASRSALHSLLSSSGIQDQQDNGDFEGSLDQKNFDRWRGDAIEGAQE